MSDLSKLSDEELLKHFEQTTVAQSSARTMKRYNRLALEAHEILKAIKSRGASTQQRLLTLISHENPQVRLVTAKACDAFSPDICRKELRRLAKLRNLIGTHAMIVLVSKDKEFRNERLLQDKTGSSVE